MGASLCLAGTRRAIAVLSLTGAITTHCLAAEPLELEDLLERPWYYTEVIVFQRPLVLDHLTEEALTRLPERLPRTLRWLAAAGAADAPPRRLGDDFMLYPGMHAYLAFPYLDQALLPRAPAADGFARSVEPAPSERDPSVRDGLPVPVLEPRLAPDPLLDLLREAAAFERSLDASSYRWLGPETLTLGNEAARLERRGGYRVLLHGRWLQPLPERASPEPLLFRTGPESVEGHALEGTFDVTIGRYLHFNARLYYREPLLGQAPIDRPQPPAPLVAVASPPALPDPTDAGVMQLVESRRLRSDELHYLDHPKLGVLVRMTAVEPPEALSQALAAFLGEDLEERQ